MSWCQADFYFLYFWLCNLHIYYGGLNKKEIQLNFRKILAYPKSGTRDPGPGTQLIGGTRDPKGGTRDSRPGTQPRGWIREPRPETLKVGLETQDRGPWKWIFDKCSQISLKPGVYKRIHLLYAFMSIFYVSHYTIIKHIHF